MKLWLIVGALTALSGGVHAAAPDSAPAPGRDLHAMAPAQLIKRDVYTRFDEDLGKVKKIVVDEQSRRPYVVVKVAGFLGLGVLHIAVPTSDIQLQDEGLIISSEVKKEKVDREYPYLEEHFAEIPTRRPIAELSREPKAEPHGPIVTRVQH
ncbi:PRC-barrel domain-containing protein [Thiohalomonas denitrificans]|uniref:PRC-barrel domain-containing protein n=1 Tax=Thiohalomonas denitrificans TaxID=415747 RepID=A0A1G5QE51_9GAMM|nr:PRC-barrel domain-containing protein [Thiohalomonas denitrificans]SCZ59967.1 PRC-barrel domain-containing protein [Thiohalomonas denitrificans]